MKIINIIFLWGGVTLCRVAENDTRTKMTVLGKNYGFHIEYFDFLNS